MLYLGVSLLDVSGDFCPNANLEARIFKNNSSLCGEPLRYFPPLNAYLTKCFRDGDVILDRND